jgi:hypothetical protein
MFHEINDPASFNYPHSRKPSDGFVRRGYPEIEIRKGDDDPWEFSRDTIGISHKPISIPRTQ